MPALKSFDYAVIRIVPRVEREEFINAGVIVFCPEDRFLATRVVFDEQRTRTLWPQVDTELVRRHLDGYQKITAGERDAGPIAQLGMRERFHWLVSPRSTIIQVSPVHTGLCESPRQALDRLADSMLKI